MIELSELHDAAQKAFPADQLRAERKASWQLIAEQGWLMIELPEELGGLGLGPDASTAIVYELGRVLSTAPLIPALLSIRAIAASDRLADKAGWLERLTTGEYVGLNFGRSTVAVSRAADGGITLNGVLPAVPDADMASHVLVCAPGFYALAPIDAAGVSVAERELWDESRRLFDISFSGHAVDPALILADGEAAAPIAALLAKGALLALSADALGGATATLDMTVEYLKTRKQFDRPLAMFQALKHRCADLKTRIVAAEALLWARAADTDSTLADLGALKALASEVFYLVAEDAIQLHGGIGLTDEHNCHLFLKRALLNAQLAGDIDQWLEVTGRATLDLLAPVS
jgi:alkylation response protein AidB-like acyl-CoA dehydrogenase